MSVTEKFYQAIFVRPYERTHMTQLRTVLLAVQAWLQGRLRISFRHADWVLPQMTAQFVGRNLCEWQQQHSRLRQLPRGEPRSDGELRLWYAQAARDLSWQPEHILAQLGPTEQRPRELADQELLLRLRASVGGSADQGWSPALVKQLCHGILLDKMCSGEDIIMWWTS